MSGVAFHLPALQVLRETPTSAAPLPFFSHDYASGSLMAVQHLLDQGLENIAFVARDPLGACLL